MRLLVLGYDLAQQAALRVVEPHFSVQAVGTLVMRLHLQQQRANAHVLCGLYSQCDGLTA